MALLLLLFRFVVAVVCVADERNETGHPNELSVPHCADDGCHRAVHIFHHTFALFRMVRALVVVGRWTERRHQANASGSIETTKERIRIVGALCPPG